MKDAYYGLFTICEPTVIPTTEGDMWSVDIAIYDVSIMSCLIPLSEVDGDRQATQAAKDWLEDSLLLALEALDPNQQRIKIKRANIVFENAIQFEKVMKL